MAQESLKSLSPQVNIAAQQVGNKYMKNSIKLAGVEFSASEVNSALNDGKSFIAKGRKLYAIKTTSQGATYAQEVYNERGLLPLVARGRFCFMTAQQANKIIGFELCLA